MPLLFDGVDDRIETSGITGAPTGYPQAMSCVVNVTNFATYRVFCTVGTDATGIEYGMNITSGALYLYNIATTGYPQSTGVLPANTWVFVGMSSASSTSHRFYAYNYATQSVILNETNTVDLGAIPGGQDTVKIGTTEAPANVFLQFLIGTYARLAFYAVDLTGNAGDAFLAMAHLGPYAVATPGLLFDFNEMAGTTVFDLRGTGNNGTMTNFPGSPWVPTSLPGPWWEESAGRVIRSQGVSGINSGLLHYNAPPNQGTPWQRRLIAF